MRGDKEVIPMSQRGERKERSSTRCGVKGGANERRDFIIAFPVRLSKPLSF
jgi:hypothetical protein